jgi:hypothetical protein
LPTTRGLLEGKANHLERGQENDKRQPPYIFNPLAFRDFNKDKIKEGKKQKKH